MYLVSVIDYDYSEFGYYPVGVFSTKEAAKYSIKEWLKEREGLRYAYEITPVEIGKINSSVFDR